MRVLTRKIVLGSIMLLPCAAVADSNCRVIEFPDHVEAVCNGAPERTEPMATEQINPRGAHVSRQRQQLEKIRTMNAQRLEAPVTSSTLGTVPESGGKGF
ncbi:hypothetical protein [Geobacter argillaceus]|uniref:Secreted protein n=1 Tax=Geobacter argillaceus TaxID=345631 RepID=A0A562WT79_9BACT|nr:hypothetical protein [Geobacter argillaceus]TWJ33597.1 hypothetical protein JN12_00274 [Geobacter argillaceus]